MLNLESDQSFVQGILVSFWGGQGVQFISCYFFHNEVFKMCWDSTGSKLRIHTSLHYLLIWIFESSSV